MNLFDKRWAVVSLIAVAACGKSSGGQPKAESVACTYHHANPKFCMAAPVGYTAKPERKGVMGNTELEFTSADGQSYFILEWGPRHNDVAMNSFKDNEKGTGAVMNDDGKGGYWEDTVKKGGPKGSYHYIYTAVKGATGWVSCMSNGPPDAEVKSVLAACRSLRWE